MVFEYTIHTQYRAFTRLLLHDDGDNNDDDLTKL